MKLIIVVIIGLLVYSCMERVDDNYVQTISSNAEITLDSTHKYGLQQKFNGLKKGEFVQASVWGKSNGNAGTFVCSIKHNDSTKTIRKIQPASHANEWYRYNIEIYVSDDNTDINFYAFSGKEKAYFKDLNIKCHKSIPPPNNESLKKTSTLNLYIPEKAAKKLAHFKKKSLEDGIISKKYKKYVNAFLIQQKDSIPVKIKLKGDWTDHLNSGKISYRIKIANEKKFLGLRTFSIQHPKTRNYMHEWFMHKLSDHEMMLSTKYEFISVKINNEYKGIYALEEHFEKQLLEKRNRRDGPILKMDETGLWEFSLMQFKKPSHNKVPILEASQIASFKKVKSDDYLAKVNFDEGVALVKKYKNLFPDIDELFDIEMLAKYYALLEIGSIEHAHQWHNKRFYFNSINQKLESIGFDMNPGLEPNADLYIQKKLLAKKGPIKWRLLSPALKNKKFKEYYLKYLKIYSNPAYLKQQLTELKESIELNESLLALEIDNFEFDEQFYINRCEKIQKDIPLIDSIWTDYLNKTNSKEQVLENYKPHKDDFFLKQVSVNGYVSEIKPNEFKLELVNFHLNSVNILGYSAKKEAPFFFNKPIKIGSYHKGSKNNELIINTKNKPHKIYYETENNIGIVQNKKVFDWPRPKTKSTRIDLKKQFKHHSDLFQLIDSTIIFNTGKLVIDQLIYIPNTYKVIFLEGTDINLINGGGIIINNSVTFNGSENNRILIHSSDSKNNGITILNSKKTSINFVDFRNLNALNYKNWILSGAISIFESVIDMKSVTIKSIMSEDALNMIRSNFTINDLKITDTKSDGLDSDFCSGTISNAFFSDNNNDAIDVSGSTINFNNIKVINSGDKGISAGEQSTVNLKKISINNTKIAISSKDGSLVNADSINIKNAMIGVSVFIKKNEYTYAKAKLKNIYFEHLKIPFLIDKNSILEYRGKVFMGSFNSFVQSLYLTEK